MPNPITGGHPASQWLQANRFLLLFLLTTASLLVPAMVDSMIARQSVAVAWLYALWLALRASGAGGILRTTLFATWAGAIGFKLVTIPGAEAIQPVVSRLLAVILLVVCVASIGASVLRARVVTADTVFGAGVAYLLLAAAFGQVHAGIHFGYADAFVVPDHLAPQLARDPDQLFTYFSFVTLATLGYGDIVPRHPVAQVVASIETVLGQLYVAVVVAWLVAHITVRRQARRRGGSDHDRG